MGQNRNITILVLFTFDLPCSSPAPSLAASVGPLGEGPYGLTWEAVKDSKNTNTTSMAAGQLYPEIRDLEVSVRLCLRVL